MEPNYVIKPATASSLLLPASNCRYSVNDVFHIFCSGSFNVKIKHSFIHTTQKHIFC